MEKQIILIKPCGVKKGLVYLILQLCIRRSLIIENYVRRYLTEDDIRKIYHEEQDKEFFGDMLDHLMSDYSYIIEVSGDNAIDIVKNELISRYPYGLRGIFSESLVKNILHAPCMDEFNYQYSIFEPYLNKAKIERPFYAEKKFIFTCGLSESGKSTFCEYLDSEYNIKRVKIRKIFSNLAIKDNFSDVDEFVKTKQIEDPFILWENFMAELDAYSDYLGVKKIVLDTLWGGPLAFFVKLYSYVLLVHIDAKHNRRITYQNGRENLSDLAKAQKMLDSRDKLKIKSGLNFVFPICHICIENNLNLDDFKSNIDEFVSKL